MFPIQFCLYRLFVITSFCKLFLVGKCSHTRKHNTCKTDRYALKHRLCAILSTLADENLGFVYTFGVNKE